MRSHVLLWLGLLVTSRGHAPPAPHLDAALVERAHQLTQAAAAPLSNEAVCTQLEATQKLAAEVTQAMGHYFDRAGVSEENADEKTLAAVLADAKRASAPGLSFSANNQEFIDVSAHFELAAFVSHTQMSPEAKAFLQAAAPLETADIASLGYEQVTDVTVCCAYEGVLRVLPPVQAASPHAPACLQQRYLPKLRRVVEDLAKCTCFCREAGLAQTQAAQLAKQVEAFPELGGKNLARSLNAPRPAGVKYACTPN
jgi:hypothetical protein